MKRIIILTLLISTCFAYEDMIIPNNSTIIEYSESNSSLINTEGMKKPDGIKQSEVLKQRKIKTDTKQMNQQRALDYMTKQTNFLVPRF